MITLTRHAQLGRPKLERGDWRSEAPHQPGPRIDWLRAEAGAMLNEALDLEKHLPYPPAHECFTCEDCRLKILGVEHV